MKKGGRKYLNKGFAPVPREVLDSPLWKRQHDEKQFSVREMRTYLTLRANWASAKVRVGKRTVHVPKNGIFTSQVKVKADTGWDRKKFRAFLRREEGADRLSFKTKWGRQSGYTLIILKDIWGLNADFKWGETVDDEGVITPDSPFNSPFSPHIQNNKELSPQLGDNSKYAGSGSGFGFGNGFSESARAGIIEVEKKFIGCVLKGFLANDPNTAELTAVLKPDDFLLGLIAKTYDCILALLKRSEPVTLIALDEELRQQNIAHPLASELVEWAEGAEPSRAHVYAESIKGASDARRSEVTT